MDDVINDVAVAEDPRLGYPSHHDWNWMDLDKNYGGWLDAAYPAINRLTRERDEARAEVERLEDVRTTLYTALARIERHGCDEGGEWAGETARSALIEARAEGGAS